MGARLRRAPMQVLHRYAAEPEMAVPRLRPKVFVVRTSVQKPVGTGPVETTVGRAPDRSVRYNACPSQWDAGTRDRTHDQDG